MRIIKRAVELTKMCHKEHLSGEIFNCELEAHQFVITGLMDGTPVAFTGSIGGRFLPPGGGDAIQLSPEYTEIDSQGRAVVTLPDSCYSVLGVFGLIITHTSGNHTTAIYAATGFVSLGETPEVVDPGNVINVDAIQGIIADMEDALSDTEAATAAAEAIVANLQKNIYIATGYLVSDVWQSGFFNANQAGKQIGTAGENWDIDSADNRTDSPNFKVTYLPCKPGDVVHAYGVGGSGGRIYGFLDAVGVTTAVGPASADSTVNGEYTAVAPANTAWAYVNNNNTTLPVANAYMAVESGDSRMIEAEERIDALYAAADHDVLIGTFTRGKYLATNGTIGSTVSLDEVSSNSVNYIRVAVAEGDRFRLTGRGLSTPRLWAFTDGDSKLISHALADADETGLLLTAPADGYLIIDVWNKYVYSLAKITFYDDFGDDLNDLKMKSDRTTDMVTDLVRAQRSLAEDWHFAFIDVSRGMGLGSNHIIPGTATLWDEGNAADLNQKEIWMEDGVHPFKGPGVTAMYARTIANQLALVAPSYYSGIGETSPSYWADRNILWMGTSIPAGSDPDAGSGSGATYPDLVAEQLDATVTNRARGSSCVRINASTGSYNGMTYGHFLRALTRTVAECDAIAADWANIYEMISGAPSTLSDSALNTMKAHSFENLLLPYLDGTNTMPDLFVFDHGHNDVRPRGVDGLSDLWIEPTKANIDSGLLAPDTYMTENSYANLKSEHMLNNSLSGISDLASFAATLNRNCFKGAANFIVTLILRYNPHARIVFISDYN